MSTAQSRPWVAGEILDPDESVGGSLVRPFPRGAIVDVRAFSTGLRESEPGYWVAAGDESVSYPEHGHSSCFELEDSSYWFHHRNKCVTSIVTRFPPGGAIVDVGGGNGFVALGLQQAGFETILVEPGAAGARNGFTRGLRHVAQSTFEDAAFKSQSLPAVGLFDVFEHIEDEEAFLGSLRRALRPEGHLYLTVPAFRWLWSPEDVQAGHFRRYSLPGLTRVLEAADFEVLYVTYFFWFLPLPVFFLRSVAGSLGTRKAGKPELSRREHQAPGGVQGALLSKLLAMELDRLRLGKRMPFGSSILAVAQKR